MISYAVEPWVEFKKTALKLWASHYEEVGQNKEKMILAPDITKADALDAAGKFHIVVVRMDGRMVGYHLTIVDTLLHYKNVLAGVGDMYWVATEFRNHGVGAGLLKEVECTLKARGVQVLYDVVKVYADHSALFEAAGYKAVEKKFTKWIGD